MFKLLSAITTLILFNACCHSKYTEAHIDPVLLFHVGDKVKSVAPCTPTLNFLNMCNSIGTVVEVQPYKSECYPQPKYIVQYISTGRLEIEEGHCADQLQLKKAYKEHKQREIKDPKWFI